jgi:hypothetical protein
MRRLLYAAVVLLTALPARAAEQAKPNTLTPKEIADGWILLFDGETKFGWKVDGDSDIKDGILTLGGKKATTATTTTAFGDYELRFECRKKDRQSRLKVNAKPIVPFLAQEQEWAEVSLKAQGDRVAIAVKTNSGAGGSGSPRYAEAAPVKLELPAQQPLMVRSVKLRPLGLKPIFNGKDLTGWKEIKGPKNKSRFTVTNKGELNVKDGRGDLQTTGQWDDFILQIEVISHGKHLNSGVFFRCLPGQFWSGYEAQIRNQWQGDDRSQPVDYGTGGIYNRQPARKVVSSDHEWFTMTVAAAGNHLAVWVNGYQTADFTDTRPPNENARKGSKVGKGPISLQGHDKTTDLSFRNIRIAELPKSAKADKKEQ